jgi:pyrimidine operon attenuation protein/uracil phosphoribosyltransferase
MNSTSPPPVAELLNKMEQALQPLLDDDTLMIGVHSGGVWLAERLHQSLDMRTALGSLDISFYRDDFSRVGLHPQVKGSHLPEDVDERSIILVDDVLHTGRTIRAALNEIFSYGRPGCVRLAVLVERDGRELPIQADVIGQHLQMHQDEYVKLSGPNQLELSITKKD